MDEANTAAAWLSFAVTTIGLGGLITQASAINAQLDPFHAIRTVEHLGIWFQRQQAFPWWRVVKPPPQGPVMSAKMSEGFCGFRTVHIARIPLAPAGKAGWSLILAMFHSQAPVLPTPPDLDMAEKAHSLESARPSTAGTICAEAVNAAWDFLPRKALTRHQSDGCVIISRTTLITMLVMTNARPVFQFSEASGYRAGYASYCGQWYMTWPIGQQAIVKFAQHDSLGKTEVLPRSFPQRVDRCGQMVSGVVSGSRSDFRVAFCGRKPAGQYRLVHGPKGFQGAHGSRHLYNMMGGKAYEVDWMFARPASAEEFVDHGQGQQQKKKNLVLTLPSKDKDKDKEGVVTMLVPPHEESVIRHALDCLPWTSLSWSMHRGLRDILLAYARPVMNRHREKLADLLRSTVVQKAHLLQARGWDPQFVRDNMGHMGASAVLAGSGNSGDSVRVVTDIVSVLLGDTNEESRDLTHLDEVDFWRRRRDSAEEEEDEEEEELDEQGIVALTKVFVLEWSQEFDYQMYHHLPISLYFG